MFKLFIMMIVLLCCFGNKVIGQSTTEATTNGNTNAVVETTTATCFNCGSGLYLNSSSNLCIDCPVGHFCPTECNEAIPCSNGYYNNETNQNECKLCPAGHSCQSVLENDALLTSTECIEGFYALEGDGICQECLPGYFTDKTASSSCIICPAGSECRNSSSTPLLCGLGHYSISASLSCLPCPDGHFANKTGSITCIPCPEGYSCADALSTPIICPLWTYSLGLSNNCENCQPGYYSMATGVSSCVICPAGSSCIDAITPVPCPYGEYSLTGQTECISCAVGYFANTTGSDACLECPPGYSCSDPLTGPVKCANGMISLPRSVECQLCPTGFYSINETACANCPHGYSCKNASIDPVACGQGFYSSDGEISCTECPNGYYTNLTAQEECMECPGGFECSSKIKPEICQPGFVSKVRSTECTVCVLGHTYAAIQGQSECNVCPEGYVCEHIDQEPTNNSCEAGYYGGLGSSCLKCQPGSYSNTTGVSECIICPSGHFCPILGGTSFLECQAGFFSTQGSANCTQCPNVYYQPLAAQDSCILCPSGHRCVNTIDPPIQCEMGSYANPGSTICTFCQPGTYQDLPGQFNCTICMEGHYCPGEGTKEPIQCSNGTFSIGGASECMFCNIGSYAVPEASTKCTTCPHGYYCPMVDMAPIICPTAYYSPSNGTISCELCPAGTFSNDTGLDSCLTCHKGHACPSMTVTPEICLPGTYSDIVGLSECKICQDGTYNTAPGEEQCYPCPAGFSCLQAHAEPVVCIAGTYSPVGVTICQGCLSGQYTNNNGSESCQTCPRNFFCEFSDQEPVPCPNGKYSPKGSIVCLTTAHGTIFNVATGLTESCPAGTFAFNDTFCEDCSPGFACLGGNANASACVEGTYQDQPKQASCLTCPGAPSLCLGKSCINVFETPVDCDPGQFSPETSSLCKVCEDGHFSGTGASVCLPCSAGKSCVGGIENDCPAGTFSVAGTGICTSCETDRHTDGLPGASSCLSCPAGSECLDPASVPLQCSNGSFSYYGDGRCSTCPSGFYCPDPAANPTECALGTYSTGGAFSSCDDCPAGESCINRDELPTPCPDGTYSLEGGGTCINCPSGFECTNKGISPIACSPGEFSQYGQINCELCDVGFSCAEPALDPYKCPVGTTTNGLQGQIECFACPAGSSCLDPTSGPVNCTTGTYFPPGSLECQSCPAGASCSGSTATPCLPGSYSLEGVSICTGCEPGFACPYTDQASIIECGEGSYSLHNQTSCTVCPPGFGCPDTDMATENPCTTGYYSFGGQSACIQCPAGQICPASDGSQNTFCLPGTWSLAEATICENCVAGTACPFTNSDTVITCDLGYYAIADQTFCTKCPAGYYCASTMTANPVSCDSGTYSIGGQHSCTGCHPGTACPTVFTSFVVTCPLGTFAEENKTACTTCPKGEYCEVTTTTGTECDDGTYSLGGQTACTDCPAGFQCLDKKSVPVVCPAGQYSAAKATTCLDCNAGYVCGEASTSATPEDGICPLGYFCVSGEVSALPCPAGLYGATTNLISSTECTDCPEGYFCEEGTAGHPVVANICPRGYYCPLDTENSVEFSCPAGTYGPNVQQAAANTACLDCPEGSYCSRGSSVPGEPCPRGHYCTSATGDFGNTDTHEPIPCTAGTYTSQEGAIVEGSCVDCPAGYYCESGTSNPQPCNAGTYQPNVRQPSSGSCLNCTAGQVCSTTALTAPDKPCSPGHFCPPSTSIATANPCPAGRFTDQFNLTNIDDCEVCPVRFACLEGTGGTQQSPVTCSPGYYCPNGTEFSDQYPCPAGSYSNKTNLAWLDECWECPRGGWCVSGSSSPQGPCPAGYYCPAGTKFDTEFPCSSGLFSNMTGNVRFEDCDDCIPGHFCGEGSVNPKECLPGTFNTAAGSDGVEDCLECTDGYYCPYNATTEPLPCGKGFFSDTGASECTICDAGYYCDEDTITERMLIDKICPAGMHCPVGTVQAPNLYNFSCPAGFYCERGDLTPYPMPCGIGTYSGLTGLKSAFECVDCTEGFFCDQTNLTEPAGVCPGGHYCPTGTGLSTSNPCPAGTFLNGTAAVSSVSCTNCLSGKYCPSSGTSEPLVCTEGNYCMPGTTIPEPCPQGTFSNLTGVKSSLECTPCIGGWYCSGSPSTEPTAKCAAGYYCVQGAKSPTPNGTTDGGAICFAGGYCPEGSSWPESCPPGSYSTQQNAKSADDCIDCPPGQFCANTASIGITGNCSAGYYCTGGASTDTQFSAEPGYYAEEGAKNQIACEVGFYSAGNRSSSCQLCEAGQYCNETAMSSTLPCPRGYFCPAGSKVPEPCPPGTYNDEDTQTNETACNLCREGYFCSQSGLPESEDLCDAGFWCSNGSTTATPDGSNFMGGYCPSGSFCERGTSSPMGTQCSPGTFNNVTHGTNSSFCRPCLPGKTCPNPGLSYPTGLCAAGFYCEGGADSSIPNSGTAWGSECAPGYYCPEGSGAQIPCPPGNYSIAVQSSFCFECEPGFQCSGIEDKSDCPTGHYCPAGTGVEAEQCPPGTYRAGIQGKSVDDCSPCDPGYYCDEYAQTVSTKFCSASYYCKSGVNVSTPETTPNSGVGGLCLAGHYCPEKTGEPIGCHSGTYSSAVGLSVASDCTNCDSGRYCNATGLTEPEGDCTGGFYCIEEATTPTPTDGVTGRLCTSGYHCPTGTPTELRCSPGGYSNMSGLAECTPCEESFYCPGETVDYTIYPCVPGYYCPQGTSYFTDNPCPPGSYGTVEKASSQDECSPCDPGSYCTGGNTTVTAPCDPGFFCLTNSTTPRPSGFVNYTDTACLCPSTDIGGPCPVGYFCPEGTGQPLPCTGGYYCETSELSNFTGPCDPGYYCTEKATRPDPPNDDTGGICPEGHWCGSATANPNPCPRGTYSNRTALEAENLCSDCTAGYFCPDPAQTDVVDLCEAGHYCPLGSSSGTARPCDVGYMCPAGSPDQVLCDSGYYQDETHQVDCKQCLAGHYCDRSDGPISDYTIYPCPEGSYCPNGTEFSTQYLCEPGNYGSTMKAETAGECSFCDVGRFCPIAGLTTASMSNNDYFCAGGFFCVAGANISTPEDGVTGYVCPKGNYCPEGTKNLENCPVRTFNGELGQESIEGCSDCTPGYYCDEASLAEPKGPCDPRYFCPLGSLNPDEENCTVGHFCPGTTPSPIPCFDGTYNNDMNAEVCLNCTAGKYCIDGENQLECPQGFYCPSGTGLDWQPCEKGTFGNTGGLQSAADCEKCPPGKYCDQLNATTYSDICEAGFYCRNGSSSATPMEDGINGLCSPGHFCTAGTEVEEPCAPGSHSPANGRKSQDECLPCPSGEFCTGGKANPDGDCNGGFYCTGNSSTASPPTEGPTGGPCPQGFRCPNGTSIPLSCDPGSYNNLAGLQDCFLCPAGYFCPENATDYSGNNCPMGHYCPNGTAGAFDHPCPAGTFNNESNGQSSRDCLPCTAGFACETSGLFEPNIICSEGFYCISCSYSRTPSDGSVTPPSETTCLCPPLDDLSQTGGRCEPGNFCPEGSENQEPCLAGYFCETAGLANVTGTCEAGFYCSGGASSARPTDGVTGDECPMQKRTKVGHHCREGSESETPCPPGTFSNQVQNKAPGDCSTCTAGYFCLGGNSVETDLCDPGFYCPPGQNVSAPAEYECPPGYKCPGGQGEAIPCESGTYQALNGMTTCDVCPESYYCEAINTTGVIIGVSVPLPCPQGYYCPNGTKRAQEWGCPRGTYGEREQLSDYTQCQNCDGGQFCGSLGLSEPTGPCLEGFFCNSTSEFDAPTDGVTGDECSFGHFCKNGTQVPEPCVAGTFGPVRGLRSQSECTNCTGGSACTVGGLREPDFNCTRGFYCPTGSTEVAAPEYECWVGYHCPEGSPLPVPCEPGTYTNLTQQYECLPCDAGSYCNGTEIQDCPMGYYCPLGTGGTLEPCPRGTYGDSEGLTSEDQCKYCDPGKYCPNLHATGFEGPCDAGYYCRNGSDSKAPSGGHTGDAGVCQPGYFCPEGTGEPFSCAPGTFNNQPQATGPEFCDNCTAGSYCNGSALSEPTGKCFEGYYCILGSASPSQSIATETGGPCPQGSFCPTGSPQPILCTDGSYASDVSMSACLPCPAGSFCPVGANATIECPYGHYCVMNSTYPVACNNGTFNNETGSTSVAACQYCIGGYYCPDEGMENPEGMCASGWYCKLGSWMKRPTVVGVNITGDCGCPLDGGIGGQCQPGYYCPEGSTDQIPCDKGYFCDIAGLFEVSGPCLEGHYCSLASSEQAPVGKSYGDICPPGNYCPTNSSEPSKCPIGQFSNHSSNVAEIDCEVCLGGWYCPSPGLPYPVGLCETGYFCPPGSTEKAPPSNECPPGTRCPTGSENYVPCLSGSYQSQPKMGVCLDCPEGQYCDYNEAFNDGELGVVTPVICPAGFYCPKSTEFGTQFPCNFGEYNPTPGKGKSIDCLNCTAGDFCDRTNQTTTSGPCAIGYFCPSGSTSETQVICPQGSYCPVGSGQPIKCAEGSYGGGDNLGSQQDCSPCDPGTYCNSRGLKQPAGGCTEGYYCSGNSTMPNPVGELFGDECQMGTYCPFNSSYPIDCPPGTYNPFTRRTNDSACLLCDAGYYCNETGAAAVSGECFEGYYCEIGSIFPTQNVCTEGHYCPPNSPIPLPCEVGTYANTTNSAMCDICPAGRYCSGATVMPLPCPEGVYCESGTGLDWKKCPTGTFNPVVGLSSELECQDCLPGFFCGIEGQSNVTGPCQPTYNCILGVDVSNPNNITNKGIGDICLDGHQCPNGLAESCPPGTFANTFPHEFCTQCTAGFYCDGGTITPQDCPKGHYCLESTPSQFTYPCPPGTFNNHTTQSLSSSCLSCLGGMYCPGTGNEVPEDDCDPGYYCVGGSSSRRPLVTGTPSSGASNDSCNTLFDCTCPTLPDTRGGICTPGYFCPKGSDMPRLCTAGKYCPDYEMFEAVLNCTEGFYCLSGSANATQYICSSGSYCEEGTGSPVPCEPGTFSPSFGNINISQCLSCPPGEYCQGYGNANPTANCTSGFFCPGGDETPTLQCSRNHKCPEGARNETVCEAGTFQPSVGRSFCIPCDPGDICDPYDGNLEPEECPQGYYCEAGVVKEQPCPIGTYGHTTGLQSMESCTDCPGGMYCDKLAETMPTAECYAGFYCSGKASQPDPFEDNTNSSGLYPGNSICPVGHYCLNGTDVPTACVIGTFTSETGRKNETECLPCPPGRYCDSSGKSDGNLAPICDAGFICVGGASRKDPNDGITGYPCPRGYYCPAGNTVPLGCSPGLYSPNEGAENCTECDPGFVCASSNMTVQIPCWAGYYCGVGTAVPEPCPESTFNDKEGRKDDSACLPCSIGSFCNGTGNSDVAGPCFAGYFCEEGSASPTPLETDPLAIPYNGPCPVGRYCPEGATAPLLCPAGRMRNTTGAMVEADCLPCDPGFYCLNEGQSYPTAPCSAGFYCPGNVSNTDPNQFVCPIGFFCPEQSSAPQPCQAGSYTPNPGSPTCDLCRPGFYCEDTTSSSDQQLCPPYSYCPAGTPYPVACPNGTYTFNTTEGLESDAECFPCPPGKYCNGGEIQDDCSAGYLCVSRAFSPVHDGPTIGCDAGDTCAGPCPAGSYCLTGQIDAIKCPENTLRETTGASQLSDCSYCPSGRWCREGKPQSLPCPVGHYCLGLNTSDCNSDAGPQPCPLYKFQNETGGEKEDDCMPCPPGFWCNETGLSDYSSSACELGFYCTGGGQPPTKCPAGRLRNETGASSVSDCSPCTGGYYCPDPVTTGVTNINGIPCEAGYECPLGSVSQLPCTAGYYCLELTSTPEICPGGYFCPNGSYTFTICDYPFYCPEGTGNPLPCDVGYQPLNISGLRDDLTTACMICPPGSYRNSSTDDKCQICPAGYFCPEGTGNYQENPCPVGHYCPEGGVTDVGGVTGFPIPCPVGTFGQQSGSEFSVCQLCPAGLYNNKEGQAACFPCGSSASSSAGAVECVCDGFNRAFQASDGSCTCQSGYIYYNEINQLQSEGNAQYSCQALVDERCSGDQARRATDRFCVAPSVDTCDVCGIDGGTFNVDYGICLCNSVTVPEEITCAVGCNEVTSSLDTTTGVLSITTTSTSDGLTTTINVDNVYGPIDALTGNADTFFTLFSPDAIYAVPPTSSDVIQSVVDGSLMAEINSGVSARKRRSIYVEEDMTSYFGRKILQTTNATATTAPPVNVALAGVINSPSICLQLNDVVMFALNLNNNNRSLSNYPEYVRNHLFNTNPTFDYGAFRQLKVLVIQSNFTVTNFAHSFLEAGTYVFADSQNVNNQIIIKVLVNGLLCGTSRIQPVTTTSLSTLGVAKQSVTNLSPDWVLITVILALFGVAALALVIGIIVWRPQDAGIYPMRYWKPRYRALGEQYVPPQKMAVAASPDAREGLGLIRERGEAEGAETNLLKDDQLLEDFNVRTLYDKLEDQTLHLSSQLHKHQNSLEGFYERINNQTEGLKNMLNKLDVSKMEEVERRRRDSAGATVIHTSLQMDGVNRDLKLAGGASMREKELLRSLEMLINKLNTGKIAVSDEVISDAYRRLQGLEEKDKVNDKPLKSAIDDWKSQGRNELIKAQQMDKNSMDQELITTERDALSNLLIQHDGQRQKILSDLDEKLAFKMQGDLSEDEMNSLLSAHERELESALGALSNERMRQMKELREQLALKRKQREAQLRKAHNKQCTDAGLPESNEEDGMDVDEELLLMEKKLEAAILDESVRAIKEEGASKEGIKLTKTFEDEMEQMVANGLITKEVRDKLQKQILEQERSLKQKMDEKREMQMKSMRERMAERKKRRMKFLKEKHDLETQSVPEMTPEIKERQEAEVEALEAELQAEQITMEKDMEIAIETEYNEALKDIHKKAIGELSTKDNVDPVLQQEILDRFRRQVDDFDHLNDAKRTKQAQDLKAKLAAKRARRAADIQRLTEEKLRQGRKKEEESRLDDLREIEEESKRKMAEDDGLDIPLVNVTDNYEIQALAREQSRLLVESESQQSEEVDKLGSDLDSKEKEEKEALEKKLQEELEKATRETKAKHEAEARSRTNLSDEQIQQLLAAHQQEIEELEGGILKQQNRQRVALREKLAARRLRKTQNLRNRQEIERQTEQVEQRKEMAQVQAKTMKEAERSAIIEGIERNGSSNSEKIIQRVLEKRQAQEFKDLQVEFSLKKKMLLEEALKFSKDQFQNSSEEMLARHLSELEKLESKGFSEEKLNEERKKLKEKQKIKLSELEQAYAKEGSEINAEVSGQWNLDFAQAKLKLKEKHYQEFSEALRELAPSSKQQLSAEEAELAARKLEETKQKLQQEQEEVKKKFAKERLDLEAEEEQRLKEAMKEFEKLLEDETEKDKLRAEKNLETLNLRKDKMLKEKRAKIKEEIERAAAAGASEEEQKKILDEHEKDVENLTNRMNRERLRVQSQLEERLKKKRKEKIDAKKTELEKEQKKNKKDFESKQKQELQKVQEKQISAMQETTKIMKKKEEETRVIREAEELRAPKKEEENLSQFAQVLSQPQPDMFTPVGAIQPTTSMIPYVQAPQFSEKDMHNMLATSPLYLTLQEIREVLSEEKSKGSKSGAAHSPFVGPDIDSSETELVPTPLSELNVRELVAYKFGVFILTLLRLKRSHHPPINLLVAEKVPMRADLAGNCFRGSFCFDKGNGILYIKRGRLLQDSVGQLSLLVVHTASHIACGDLTSDLDLNFVQEFYQCLAVLSDDLFFARYKDKPDTFKEGKMQSHELTKDLLDVKLLDRDFISSGDTTSSKSFHQRAVGERLGKYAQVAISGTVREELGGIEEKVNNATMNGTLDKIDEKLLSLLPTTSKPSLPNHTHIEPMDESDNLNEEFINLSREADQLHSALMSSDGSRDEMTVRNRLTNVQIKLSDVQRRFQFSH